MDAAARGVVRAQLRASRVLLGAPAGRAAGARAQCFWVGCRWRAAHIANAYARLGKMQLEPADILHSRRLGCSFEKLSEPLTAVDVAPLRLRPELAGIHVLDHPPAQRSDSIDTHGQLLSWMRLTTPRSSRQDDPHATDHLSSG